MTKLVSSAQAIFKAGLRLFLMFTQRKRIQGAGLLWTAGVTGPHANMSFTLKGYTRLPHRVRAVCTALPKSLPPSTLLTSR